MAYHSIGMCFLCLSLAYAVMSRIACNPSQEVVKETLHQRISKVTSRELLYCLIPFGYSSVLLPTGYSPVSCAVSLATTAGLPSWSKDSVIEVSGMQQGVVISCWAPYGHVNVQSATEKAHDVKKAGEGKKKAAPKKVSAASLHCPAYCTAGSVRHLPSRRNAVWQMPSSHVEPSSKAQNALYTVLCCCGLLQTVDAMVN